MGNIEYELNDAITSRREFVDVEDHTVAVKVDDGATNGEWKVKYGDPPHSMDHPRFDSLPFPLIIDPNSYLNTKIQGQVAFRRGGLLRMRVLEDL